jgi:hypothetical protein
VAAVDGLLIGGPGTSNIPLSFEQFPQVEGRAGCRLGVAAVDDPLKGGPRTSHLSLLGEL